MNVGENDLVRFTHSKVPLTLTVRSVHVEECMSMVVRLTFGGSPVADMSDRCAPSNQGVRFENWAQFKIFVKSNVPSD